MSEQSKKEELLLRNLTVSNFSTSQHEDLSDLVTLITPKDVPLFSRLGRIACSAITHEWTEDTNTTTFTDSVYADGSAPADNTFSTARRSNKVMSIGRIAKATELLVATDTVGKSLGMDAFAREVEHKMVDLIRAIEYWMWSGDVSQTSPQQMDGIINTLATGSNTVSNAGSAEKLNEAKLQEAILACYTAGGAPSAIYARPTVCQRIANFNQDKVRFVEGGGAGGTNKSTMRYLSPLGYDLEVVPVRGDFLPTGKVYVLDESQIKLVELGGLGIRMKELSIGSADIVANRLLKAYLTMELRAKLYHSVISNVTDALS